MMSSNLMLGSYAISLLTKRIWNKFWKLLVPFLGSVEWLQISVGIEDWQAQLQGRVSHSYKARAGRLAMNFVARPGSSISGPTEVASMCEALCSSSAQEATAVALSLDEAACGGYARRRQGSCRGGKVMTLEVCFGGSLMEVDLPICIRALYVAGPVRVLETSAGNLWASTLKQRVSSLCLVFGADWRGASGALLVRVQHGFS